jgi:hypothetical protein
MPQKLHGSLPGPPSGPARLGRDRQVRGDPRRERAAGCRAKARPGARRDVYLISQSLWPEQDELPIMAGAEDESVVGQYYDPSKNQLPSADHRRS